MNAVETAYSTDTMMESFCVETKIAKCMVFSLSTVIAVMNTKKSEIEISRTRKLSMIRCGDTEK